MNQSPQSVLVGNLESSLAAPMISNAKANMDAKSNDDNDAANRGIDHPRSLVFELTCLVGELSATFLRKVPLDDDLYSPLPPAATNDAPLMKSNEDHESPFSMSRPNAIDDEEVCRGMARTLLKLLELSHALSLPLGSVVVQKMQLNMKKYPADLCRGKAGKYTEYSAVTGITKEEGQSTQNNFGGDPHDETVAGFLSDLGSLTQDIGSFASKRQWTRYHKPRNLLLALIGELGELAELFQWRGDHPTIDSISAEDKDKIGQELADVTIYLIRLSDVCHIDLKQQVDSLTSGYLTGYEGQL